MTNTIRSTAIAAVTAITIAASMASPANALSKKGAFFVGLGAATAIGLAASAAHAHNSGYYNDGYYEDRAYRRAAKSCADRYAWRTWKWERCMDRKGF
jgi:hypothetical protein